MSLQELDVKFAECLAEEALPAEVRAYLTRRHVLPSTLQRWGGGHYCSPDVQPAAPGLPRSRAVASKLFVEIEGTQDLLPRLGGRICLPRRDEAGNIISWLGRTVDGITASYEPEKRWLYLPGQRGDVVAGFGWVGYSDSWQPGLVGPRARGKRQRGPVFICEGVFDALLLDQAGYIAVTTDGCFAHRGKQGSHLLARIGPVMRAAAQRGDPVIIIFDNDEPNRDPEAVLSLGRGLRGACELAARIASILGPRVGRIVRLARLPGTAPTDIADVLANVTVEHDPKTRPVAHTRSLITGHRRVLDGIVTATEAPFEAMVGTAVAAPEADRVVALREIGVIEMLAADPDQAPTRFEHLASMLGVGPRHATMSRIRELVNAEVTQQPFELGAGVALRRGKSGAPLVSLGNLHAALRHLGYGGRLRWCTMTLRMEVAAHRGALGMTVPEEGAEPEYVWRPLLDADVGDVTVAVEGVSIMAKRNMVGEAMLDLAQHCPHNPADAYLRGLGKWDGVDRIPELVEAMGIDPGQHDHALVYLRRWMISAVARASRPGSKVDTVLVLVGAQGHKKSMFAQAIAPPGLGGDPEVAAGSGDKDAALRARRYWIAEMSELDRDSHYSHLEAAKAWISRQVDTLRVPYGRAIADYPRCMVFVGTSNSDQVLADSTGSRRYWPLTVIKKIDDARVGLLRDQLWAQAHAAYLAREQWWLTDEEERLRKREASRYEVDDPMAEKVGKYLGSHARDGFVTTEELTDNFDIHSRRANRIMRALGWTRVQTVRGEKKRGFRAPEGWSPPPEHTNPDIVTLFPDAGEPDTRNSDLAGHLSGADQDALIASMMED